MILRYVWKRFAPSMAAASSSERGNERRKPGGEKDDNSDPGSHHREGISPEGCLEVELLEEVDLGRTAGGKRIVSTEMLKTTFIVIDSERANAQAASDPKKTTTNIVGITTNALFFNAVRKPH